MRLIFYKGYIIHIY